MSSRVHPTAVIHPDAVVSPDTVIGPFVVIGPGVVLERHSTIAAHAVIECNTLVGERCYVGVGSVLGSEPQDMKFAGEETWLEIGDDTRIREHVTLNRGTSACGRTTIGRRCFLMAYVHVAHDCVVEDDVVLANGVQLAGHVHVEQHANVGGWTPVHQFVRIGTRAFVGGGSRLPRDVPPYTKAAGNPIKLYGLNTIGLTRAGFDAETRAALKHAYRLLFNSELTPAQAIEQLRRADDLTPEATRLIDFVAESERGVLV